MGLAKDDQLFPISAAPNAKFEATTALFMLWHDESNRESRIGIVMKLQNENSFN